MLLQTCQNDFIAKARNNNCWHGCGEKGTVVHCWWEWKLVQPLRITVWSFIKKLKMELPYNPAIPLLDIYPKERKLLTWKDICNPMFTVALLTIAKTWKQSDCPLMDDGWIKKTWNTYIYIYIHTHTDIHIHIENDILLSHKKKEIVLSVTTWMEFEGITLSEISQRKTNTVWYYLYVESKRNKQTKNEDHRYRE